MPRDQPGVLLVSRSFIINEYGKLLLVQRSVTDRHNPGLWECPGGKLDQGEDLSASRVREVEEETGLVVETVHSGFFTEDRVINDGSEYDGVSYVAIFSIAQIVSGELRLSEEHDEAVWVTCEEALNYKLTPEVKRAMIEFALLRSLV